MIVYVTVVEFVIAAKRRAKSPSEWKRENYIYSNQIFSRERTAVGRDDASFMLVNAQPHAGSPHIRSSFRNLLRNSFFRSALSDFLLFSFLPRTHIFPSLLRTGKRTMDAKGWKGARVHHLSGITSHRKRHDKPSLRADPGCFLTVP